MKILAIDTSCDDTAISVLKAQKKRCFEILSNVVSSQVKVHQKYGGVYPSLAKREHQKNLVPVLKKALEEAGLLEKIRNPKSEIRKKSQIPNSNFQTLKAILEREPKLLKKTCLFLRKYQKPKIDAIAVTIGPGLEPCLWQGVNFAKALSFYWKLPIIPVNHIEAHILANWLTFPPPTISPLPKGGGRKKGGWKILPAICLVVSGGHTQLVLMPKIGEYKIIGETRDDAAGECLDKTARILGLGYPGGPAIAAEAAKFPISNGSAMLTTLSLPKGFQFSIQLPRPMLNSKDYDFSFSGLKTAVLYEYRKRPRKVRESKGYIRAMAKEIQQAIIDVLIQKTLQAAKEYKAKTVILGGGVASNQELRNQLQKKVEEVMPNSLFLIPNSTLCTDNGAMVAITAFFHQKNKKHWKKIKVNANLRI